MRPELVPLLDLTQRVGRDPLLTQASTGNSSAKLDGVLWIKASGKWMADAAADDFLVPLDLSGVLSECRRQVDPTERFAGASLETALHAILPHRMVVHVHCINTIAWAVRSDAESRLQERLDGLSWQWIPYAPSGLPLAEEMGNAMAAHPATDVFVLGNHGLVVCGNHTEHLEQLLGDLRRRLTLSPRQAPAPNYQALEEIADGTGWELPKDETVHALATDSISREILAGGLLYPCQAIFSDGGEASAPPFRIVEKCGVLVNHDIGPAELAMIQGLTQVVQRLSPDAPLRYLTREEISAIPGHVASRYRDLANQVSRS